ncbi:uncharacterized protein LOC111005306 [Momordica charantia]|uniref:Uncharacterized protein LOC111005306 n=1 Tax=Momordica charantia TaxID=3673 RepID=A0A6J1BSI1_MOMCH|nr:uncharacterized protein LOC111005306 [Momordica charantia]
MSPEAMIQVALFILTAATLLAVRELSKRAFGKVRPKNRAILQSSRHFFEGTHLLARARSTSQQSQSFDYAKKALTEAETALSLSPKDPASHILKALALDHMGHQSSALKSLDVALSPPCLKSLSGRELGKALIKRAELKIAVNRKRRLDSAVEDLLEAVRLGVQDPKGFCLLGQCYEWKQMKDEAKQAFEKALTVDPESSPAREGLERLN